MLNRRNLGLAAGALALVPHRRAGAATKELRFRLVEDPEMLWSGQSVSLTVNTVVGTYLVERLVYQGTEAGRSPGSPTAGTSARTPGSSPSSCARG